SIEDFPYKNSYQPFDIVEIARSRPNNIGVAYTYNEPTVWYEFMHDTTKLIAQAGLKNVIVSNGYINEEPLLELLPWIHAVNIDLKGFTEDFYKTVTGAQLEPVKKTLTILAKSNVHFEITNLVIPGSNDDEVQFIEMIDWIADLLGKNTILHLSRYFPMYRMKNEATSPLLLEKLYALARKRLFYVYVGNIQLNNYQDTKCNQCGHIAVVRSGYSTELSGIDKSGRCKYCGNIVIQDI
ncbi:MAG: radical SAM protein, partial [Bacteroidales bacterium]|nr:radical SAM protein [Bacteroidales bacterium]